MNRGRYYAVVMPIAALLYAIVLLVAHNGTVVLVGAVAIAVLAVAGTAIPSSSGTP